MRNFVFLICAFFSTQAFGDYVWHHSLVERIYPQANGNLVLTFQDEAPDCQRSYKYHHIAVGVAGITPEAVKSMLAVVLTAAELNMKVSVYYDKDHLDCHIARLYLKL